MSTAGRQRFGVRRSGRVRHVVQERARHSAFIQPRHRGRRPVDLQRVQRGRTVDDGRRPAAVVVPGVSDQGGEARRVQRGGHGDEGEVAAQLADLVEHAEQQVGLEAAFVHFVEDDGGCCFQSRIREQAVQQDARGDKFDQGARPGLAFAADRVPHAVPQPAAVQRSETPGRRTGGNPARLGDDDARRCPPVPAAGAALERDWPATAGRALSCPCPVAPAPRRLQLALRPAARRPARRESRAKARPDPMTARSKGAGAGGNGTAGEVTLPLCLQSRGAGSFRN